MRLPWETIDQFVARVNASGYVPPPEPSGNSAKLRSSKMPKLVRLPKNKEFEFKSSKSGGFASKYPWDQWFDGSLLLLERSEGPENDKGTIEEPTVEKDYGVPNDAMGPKIHTAARRRYKVVQISKLDADGHRLKDSLIIRARDMTPEERQEEDILRAEEKEKAKAKLTEVRNAASTTANGTPVAPHEAQAVTA